MLRKRVVPWLIVLAVVATLLVEVPGTEATPLRTRYASAALLPATPSAQLAGRRLARPAPAAKVVRQRGLRTANVAPDVAYPTGPADGAVVVTTTPTLTVAPASDGEGDAVTYRFKVTTKPDAETGTIVADTSVATPSFTLPEGALRDGVTYFWHVTTSDATNPAGTAPGWVQAFRVDLRLGTAPGQPFDQEGLATVNLTNGNLVLSASSVAGASLGGPVGIGLTYNSQAPSAAGLLGTYTLDPNGNHVVDAGETASLVRRDATVAFDWGTGPPAPGMTATDVVAKWTGTVTLPGTGSSSYRFGAVTSGGVRIRVNGALVLDSWTTHTPGAALYDGAVTLAAGTPATISVDWFQGSTPGAVAKLVVDGGALHHAGLDPSWLATDSGPLPRGWSLAPLGGSGLAYVRAEVSDQQVVLFGPDGSTHVYTSTGTGFTPPKDEDGVLAHDAQGRLTLDATDGTTYVFDANGLLASATSTSASPTSHTYAWATPSGSSQPRLTTITDPASGRSATLRYGGGGACPAGSEADELHVPTGFDASAPTGMLCAFELWDGRMTRLWYSNGQLARIEGPGGSVTDLVNDSQGRPVKVRDPLASDLVASGARTDGATWTEITYSGGKVVHVQLAAPTAGAPRPGHQYSYAPPTAYVYVDGLAAPSYWARSVTWDGDGRDVSDTDAGGRTTTRTWTATGLLSRVVDPSGLETTYQHDHAGRVIDSWGPAPSAWFTADHPDAAHASQVPLSLTSFDEGMQGLDALYFANPTWTGAPVAHTFGVPGVGDGSLHGDFGSSAPVSGLPPAWSARFTGEISFPQTGVYTLSPNAMGPTKVFIDDTKVIDTTVPGGTSTYDVTTANARHRLRVEYSTPGGTASVTYNQVFAYTGGPQTFTVPGGVSSVTVEAWGAQGARKAATTPNGGEGGYAKGTIAVTPGQSLQVDVGGTGACGYYDHATSAWVPAGGGWNGGGLGSRTGCGGGGASDVRQGGTFGLTDRKVVAGGGGGGAVQPANTPGNYGGAGGGASGAAVSGASGAGGGSPSSGGAGASPGGQTGTSGSGGNAGAYEDGGGGGGGWWGGGGGAGTGTGGTSGGGGSGYVTSSASGATLSVGGRTGNGQVKISWQLPASLDLHWTPPGGTDVRVPGSALTPRYGLVTRSTDPDGRVTTNEYADPSTGEPTASVVDPSGRPLRTASTYEATGYRRQLTRTLPKGGTTTFTYASGTANVPCPGGATGVDQGKQLASMAGPDRTDDRVYDAAGRVVATRVHNDATWSCTAYDRRDRVTDSWDPSGKHTTTSYGLDGTTTVTYVDSANVSHTLTTTVDMLGRVLTSTDELGTVSRVAYDQPGRVATTYRQLPSGPELPLTSASYDPTGVLTSQSDWLTGAARTVSYGYDSGGRLVTTTRPNGVVTTQTYDALGRLGQVANAPAAGPSSQTFAASGSPEWFTVPTGVRAVSVVARGAQGAGADGGLGGEAAATIPVNATEALQVNVGTQGSCASGAGGSNGGGAGAGNGCGGGGASDVRQGGAGLVQRKVVAGGGGGQGSSATFAGGAGGGSVGSASPGLPYGAGGGTDSTGGAPATSGAPGSPGLSGTGGAGSSAYGGGGGGGWFGGAGGGGNGVGSAAGGGGGSGHVSGVDTAMSTGVRTGDGQVVLTWDALPDVSYAYSLGGRVVARTTDARITTYAYDGAGRLVGVVDDGTSRTYTYDDDGNRCRLGAGSGCDSANWTYDPGDRITKSPYASAYTYDSHGNVTATTGTSGNPSATIGYDANDHATVVDDGTSTVTETLSPAGRVLRRVVTTDSSGAVTEDTSYGYAGGGDSPAYSRPTAGGAITTYLPGLGGLVVVGTTPTWSLYNSHGDVLGATDASGTFTAAPQADEFGVAGSTPSNRLGWLGQQQRPAVGGALGLYRMGVRLYDPRLGRFLEVDNVLGGSCNDYDYVCGDPINRTDLAGEDMTFDEFMARLYTVSEFVGDRWLNQIYNNASKIAFYIVVTVNKQTGSKQIDHNTGHNKVADMIEKIQRRYAPKPASLGDTARAVAPAIKSAAGSCVHGIVDDAPIVSGTGEAGGPAGGLAGAAGACVHGIVSDHY